MIFLIFCRFYFFNIELVKNYSCSFFHKILQIATVFPHIVFFRFFYDFVRNYICQFYFFNMKLVDNLAL
jgi:hypothetical protein